MKAVASAVMAAAVAAAGWAMQGSAIVLRFRCCTQPLSLHMQPMRDEAQGGVEGVEHPFQSPVQQRTASTISAMGRR
jgi:hypothetical protein